MAVVIETTLGDITVDLYLEQRPVTCLNFLKLCKMKYYNFNLFHSIRSGFIAQTGDPSGEGSGGQSIFGVLEGADKRFFSGEKMPKIRHTDAGLISMVCTDDMMVGSQFFFTLAPDLDSLDSIHCVIGEVTEGHDVLRKLNEVICDESHRPYRDVRITHTVVLEDPFNDPQGLRAPSRSPSPSAERLKGGRIAPDEDIDETGGKTAEEIQEIIEEKEAKARATILEIVGDLPDADIAPPENVLFVCKLNPVTTDDDLEIIFSRFGKIVSCEVIRDKKTGDSLQYAFIEFGDKKSCEDAYFKMDNVLIDDRRIHVDFSQSVSKMRWLGKGRGVKYFDEDEDQSKDRNEKREYKHNKSRDRENNRNHHNHKKNNDYKRHENRERDRDRQQHSSRYSRHDKSPIEKTRQEKNSNEKCRHENNSSENSRHDNRSKENSHRHERSRSVSKHERFKDDYRNDRHKNYDHNRNAEKDTKEYKQESSRSEHYKNKENSNSHKSRLSPLRTRIDKSRENKEKRNEERDHEKKNKKTNLTKQNKEPQTPSPDLDKNKNSKQVSKARKIEKLKRSDNKKKRKLSTSSSDSSTESSSSSSSSSDEGKKKKSLKRKKKKYSTSSSSSTSDSSSSSTTSSSDCSSSSSSSTDSDSKKKRRKIKKKK